MVCGGGVNTQPTFDFITKQLNNKNIVKNVNEQHRKHVQTWKEPAPSARNEELNNIFPRSIISTDFDAVPQIFE